MGEEGFLRLGQNHQRCGRGDGVASYSSPLLLVVMREPLGQLRERWGRWEGGVEVRAGKSVERRLGEDLELVCQRLPLSLLGQFGQPWGGGYREMEVGAVG